MEEKRKVPRIRFKGFTNNWEQRKLEEFGISTGGTSIESEFSENGKYKVISIGSYSETSVYNDQGIRAIHSDKTKVRVLNKDDLAMILNDKTASGRIIGRVLYIDKSGEYVYNQRTERIEIDNNFYSSRFIYQLLNAPEMRNKIIKQSQGNTQIFVNWTGIKNTEYLIPNIHEQIKLAEIFDNLDNLITLHQRKCDKLVEIKKSLLEKMFPKDSSKIPEIRFKGFTDNWEQCKFEDELQTVTDYVAAGSFADLAENVKYLNEPDYAQLVRTMDLKNNFTSKEQIFVDKKAFDYLWRVNLNKESIILPNIGNCGEIYLINKEKLRYKNNVLGPNAILVRSITNNNKFLSYSFQTKRFQDNLKLIISPNGQTKFNKTDLKAIEITIPKTSEQVKIGNLLKNIDCLITLYQCKLKKLKELKKSMLEKMFI